MESRQKNCCSTCVKIFRTIKQCFYRGIPVESGSNPRIITMAASNSKIIEEKLILIEELRKQFV